LKTRLAPLRGAALVAAGGGLLVLAVTGGELANGVLRALSVVALVGIAGAALHRRRSAAIAPPAVSVMERRELGREAGIAVLAAEGRRLLVGYGQAGVALLAELGAGLETHASPREERLPRQEHHP
jgi:hypothetical protein